ncbi:MAG TPA: FAD-dependent oxidoreductase, partial [Thermosynechococcaceae cyanobacterium]
MAGDYDLVVIGGGEAGVAAATKAARLQARVALVEQGRSIDPGYVTRRVLLEASRSRYSDPFSLNSSSAAEIDRAALVVQLQQWADATVSRLADLHAPAVLASLGVEVIVGSGAFYRKPTLGFEVNGRSLRSRHYFLAAGSCLVPSSPVSLDPVSPHIDGLQTVGFLDVSAIEPAHLRQLDSLVVLGKGPASVELSQALARLGWRVTLATSDDRLLPQSDPEAAQLIQAHLEAEGVRVLSHAPVTQVRSIDRKKWVQVGKQAIEA